MPAATKKKPARQTGNGKKSGTGRRSVHTAAKPFRREAGAVVCLLLAIFAALGCFGVDAVFIRFFRELLSGLFGYGFYAVPFVLLLAAFVLGFHRGRPVRLRVTCALLLPLVLGVILHLFLAVDSYQPSLSMFRALYASGIAMESGGACSGALAVLCVPAFSRAGTLIVFVILAFFMILGAFHLTLADLYEWMTEYPHPEYEPYEEPEPVPRPERERKKNAPRAAQIDIPVDDPPVPVPPPAPPEPKKGFFNRKPGAPPPDTLFRPAQAQPEPAAAVFAPEPVPAGEPAAPSYTIHKYPPVAPQPSAPAPEVPAGRKEAARQEMAAAAAEVAQSIESRMQSGGGEAAYQYPPVSLLTQGIAAQGDGNAEARANAERLSGALESFGIDARLTDITRGPSVTRYEYELDRGVKLNKITNLADDIALSLGATGVRIAPIPDKISVVGIEVPNKLVSTVYIRDVIDSPEFRKTSSRVSFALGKDIGGANVVGNIAKLPHLLIAGTTGSGKSVCMNSLIISLLYKSTPEEVRLIMIDPKMIELGIYNGIPHLLIPVVTDPKKAAGALQWAVVEMMKRYKLFSELNVRDIFAYNSMAEKDPERRKLPQIVVVIDELADLMLVAAKEVEESVCRIAQMARAAGMHLVIATQRPSADVITGIMKANIPSRIAFAVASSLESRIILDTQGAEKLVGRGDMLYFPLGAGKPLRVQGCMISSEEIEAVVDFVKKSGQPDYSEEIIRQIEQHAQQNEKNASPGGSADGDEPEEGDDLLPAAIEVVLDTGQASVSMLQRRLKLGYSRAARLVDQMEERGIVGPFEGSKPRQLLITRAQWQEKQLGAARMELPPEDFAGPEETGGEDS